MSAPRLFACAALAFALPAQTLAEVEAAAAAGRFDVAFAIRALDADAEHEEVGRMAAAIVRHDWFELPDALFAGLDGRPRAQRRLLDELARGPRPAAAAWLRQQATAKEGRSVDHRMLALAALGEPLDRAGAALMLEAIGEPQVGDGYYLALPLLPSKLADGLVGRVHQQLMQGEIDAERLTFLVDRLSQRGVEGLLGLCVTLDVEVADVLLRHVYEQRPELVRERAAAALDGDAPPETLWLPFARHVLAGDEARVDRLVAIVADGADEVRQERALESLIAHGVVDERVLRAALDDVDATTYVQRVSRVLHRQPSAVPAARLVSWLAEAGKVQEAAARAACNRAVLEPEVQAALLALLDGVEAAGGGVVYDAVLALTLRGDAAALQRVWPLVTGSPRWSELLDRLGHREEPFVYQQLLADLADGEPDGSSEVRDQQRDMIRLLLVGHGDRRELATLVRRAPQRDSRFLRRCRHYADRLEPEHAQQLFDAAIAAADPDVAAELLEWVAAAGGDVARERMWAMWNEPPESDAVEELLEIALRVLTTGAHRPQLLARLRAQLREAPLADRLSSLPYELLNSVPSPATHDDLRLCAELVLWPPLGDPQGERQRAQRWPDGTFGFPLVGAVATRLRGADPLAAEMAFTDVVDELAADPRAAAISPQRLKVFWRSLAGHRELLVPLARRTAALWILDDDDDDEVTPGAALWLQARQLELDEQFVRAEERYRAAARALLWRPDGRIDARWLLGERDAGARRDPWARLAAAPHRVRLLAARAAGDDEAARAAAARVREFAGHDAATLATLKLPTKESDR